MVDQNGTLWFPSKRAQLRQELSLGSLDRMFPPEWAALCIHGIGGFAGNLSPFIEPIYEEWQERITFCAPNLPGHGTKPEDLLGVTWQHWVDAGKRAYLDEVENGAKRLIGFGYSMGAEVTSCVAAEMSFDPRFAGLVLVNGPAEVQNVWAPLPSAPLVGKAVRRFRRQITLKGAPDKNPDNYAYPWVPSDTIDQLNQLREAGRRARSKINPNVRVLIVQGTADETVKPGGAIEMFSQIASPAKSLEFVAGADHFFSNPEHKARLNIVLGRFLEDVFGERSPRN